MIRKLLATTALATLVASGAYAQDNTQNTQAPAVTAPPATDPATTDNAAAAAPVQQADGSLVTNVMGEDVYNGTDDNAEKIGEVNDLVFDKDGQVKSVVIGVGGFLGVGEKNVAFDYNKLQWAEKNGDRWLVAQTSKDELNAQPAFDTSAYEPDQANDAATNDTAASDNAASGTTTAQSDTATAPAGTTAAPADGNTTAQNDTTMAPADSTAPADTTMAPDTAQNDTATDNKAAADAAGVQLPAEGMLASNIIGEDVYNGTADNAEKIGDVNDVLLSKEGKAESLIIGVGGFLGVGEKSVAFNWAEVQRADRDNDSWFVVQGTKEQLEGMPDFDRRPYDPAPATTAQSGDVPAATTPAVDTAQNDTNANTTEVAPSPAAPSDQAAQDNAGANSSATAPADQTAQDNAGANSSATAPADQNAQAPAANSTDTTQTGAIDKSTLKEMPMNADISAEDLIGTTVYGANDVNVGEVGDVALNAEGKVDAIVIDVGGFLGVGEKPVAVGMDNLKFMTDQNGNKYLYTNLSKEQLEAQTAYDKGTYAQQRDQQRLTVQ